MKQAEEKNYEYLYYVIGLFFGLVTGAVLEKGLIWIPAGGVIGLFFAAFFVHFLVKGREEA